MPQTLAFTYHKNNGWATILGVLLFLGAVEIVAIHLLVQGWSPVAAWTLTALSLYTFGWLIADYRAMRSRPIRLAENRLTIESGLRWRVQVSLANMERMERFRPANLPSGKDYLSLAVMGEPDALLFLREPATVIGPMGLKKSTRVLGISVDDPGGFESSVKERLSLLPEETAASH
jgi:hypothetical protein